MYIALETFTSQHKRYYQQGEEINSFVYFTMTDGDKKKFKKKVENIRPQPGFLPSQPIIHEHTTVIYEDMPIIDTIVEAVIINELLTDETSPQFEGFGGGSGGGAGAGGNWEESPTPSNDDDNVSYEPISDTQDNTEAYDDTSDFDDNSGNDN